MQLIFLVFILLMGYAKFSFAAASACLQGKAPVNLSQQFPDFNQKVPKDQGSSGLCAPFALSSVMDSMLVRNGFSNSNFSGLLPHDLASGWLNCNASESEALSRFNRSNRCKRSFSDGYAVHEMGQWLSGAEGLQQLRRAREYSHSASTEMNQKFNYQSAQIVTQIQSYNDSGSLKKFFKQTPEQAQKWHFPGIWNFPVVREIPSFQSLTLFQSGTQQDRMLDAAASGNKKIESLQKQYEDLEYDRRNLHQSFTYEGKSYGPFSGAVGERKYADYKNALDQFMENGTSAEDLWNLNSAHQKLIDFENQFTESLIEMKEEPAPNYQGRIIAALYRIKNQISSSDFELNYRMNKRKLGIELSEKSLYKCSGPVMKQTTDIIINKILPSLCAGLPVLISTSEGYPVDDKRPQELQYHAVVAYGYELDSAGKIKLLIKNSNAKMLRFVDDTTWAYQDELRYEDICRVVGASILGTPEEFKRIRKQGLGI